MIRVYLQRNFRQLPLDQYSRDVVPVRQSDGEQLFFDWGGFIDHQRAWFLCDEGLAQEVTLVLNGWSQESPGVPRVRLAEGEYLQGCQLERRVYAVLRWGVPQIVMG